MSLRKSFGIRPGQVAHRPIVRHLASEKEQQPNVCESEQGSMGPKRSGEMHSTTPCMPCTCAAQLRAGAPTSCLRSIVRIWSRLLMVGLHGQ